MADLPKIRIEVKNGFGTQVFVNDEEVEGIREIRFKKLVVNFLFLKWNLWHVMSKSMVNGCLVCRKCLKNFMRVKCQKQ